MMCKTKTRDFLLEDVFISNLPTLDLHGEIRASARVLVKEFLEDNYKLRNFKVLIVHGIGTGALKEEVFNILKFSKIVESYHLNHYNSGCTVVFLKKRS